MSSIWLAIYLIISIYSYLLLRSRSHDLRAIDDCRYSRAAINASGCFEDIFRLLYKQRYGSVTLSYFQCQNPHTELPSELTGARVFFITYQLSWRFSVSSQNKLSGSNTVSLKVMCDESRVQHTATIIKPKRLSKHGYSSQIASA